MNTAPPQTRERNQGSGEDHYGRNAQLLAPDFRPADGLRKQEGKSPVLEFAAEGQNGQQRDTQKNPQTANVTEQGRWM
jgi:hypothetical protein